MTWPAAFRYLIWSLDIYSEFMSLNLSKGIEDDYNENDDDKNSDDDDGSNDSDEGSEDYGDSQYDMDLSALYVSLFYVGLFLSQWLDIMIL